MSQSFTRRSFLRQTCQASLWLSTLCIPSHILADQTTGASAPNRAAAPHNFQDTFETDKRWGSFEEIVGGSTCYGTGLGQVKRSRDVSYAGAYSLRVWANKKRSLKSNHLIANKKVFRTGQTGRWRYQLYAYIAPETGNTGQTGPEFSMQNTRTIGNQSLTSTAGIQYQANPFLPQPGTWAVWYESAPGQAVWDEFLVQPLTPGQWYYMAVEADYTTNKYVKFWLRGDNTTVAEDLSHYSIAYEDKGFDEAFWLTLEGENLYSCQQPGIYEYKMYYDNIRLRFLE